MLNQACCQDSSIIAAAIGAIVGGAIALIGNAVNRHYNKKDEAEKDRKERFKQKAELYIDKNPKTNADTIKMEVIFTEYNAKLDKNGYAEIIYPKEHKNNSYKEITLYLKNIGSADINELEIAVATPKNTALLDKTAPINFIEHDYVSYGVSTEDKVRQNNDLELTIYYLRRTKRRFLDGASLIVFYRDSLNNTCHQLLCPLAEKISEPRYIDYRERSRHVSINENLEYLERRLREQGAVHAKK